jgi:hypothetical protein
MGKCHMSSEDQIKSILKQKFDSRRVDAAIEHFVHCMQKFEEGDWEASLIKSGKFIEAIIKLLWLYAGKTLPVRSKEFKASVYAQNIINQISTTIIADDGVRLQIPRASIFAYDIASNRGGRHDAVDVCRKVLHDR